MSSKLAFVKDNNRGFDLESDDGFVSLSDDLSCLIEFSVRFWGCGPEEMVASRIQLLIFSQPIDLHRLVTSIDQTFVFVFQLEIWRYSGIYPIS